MDEGEAGGTGTRAAAYSLLESRLRKYHEEKVRRGLSGLRVAGGRECGVGGTLMATNRVEVRVGDRE